MGGQVVVLARGDDVGAWGVAEAIVRRRGRDAVVGVRPEQLAAGCRWHHSVTSAGAHTTVELPGGRRLVDREISSILNRVEGLPAVRFLRSSARDREYAGAELQALYVSWLHAFGHRVVNPVDGHGPVGRWSRLRWMTVAAHHGLPIARSASPPDQEVLVVGTRAMGPLAQRHGPACVAAAGAAGCSLVAFRFSGRDEPRLAEVDPAPTLLDRSAVEAVADHLLDEGEAQG